MRADAKANREAIIKAARRLIGREGMGVSYRRIAAEAGVGVATVHRHFPEISDLIIGFAEHNARIVRSIAAAHEDEWETDPAAAFHGIVSELADTDLPSVAEVLFGYADENQELLALSESVRAELGSAVTDVLDRAREAGVVRDDVGPQQLMLGVSTIAHKWPDVIYEQIPGHQEFMVDVFVAGLAPRDRGSGG